ncbi:hypothetical protein HAX54_015583, partial [Datura stramonium]|nr:hypothetical protein [Datura stramonium]
VIVTLPFTYVPSSLSPLQIPLNCRFPPFKTFISFVPHHSSLSALNSLMVKIPPKGSRCSSKRLKSSTPSPSHVEIFDSSSNECPKSASSLKKPSSSVPKKGKIDSSASFNLNDMQKFWS